jgi:hypothetical protein
VLTFVVAAHCGNKVGRQWERIEKQHCKIELKEGEGEGEKIKFELHKLSHLCEWILFLLTPEQIIPFAAFGIGIHCLAVRLRLPQEAGF